MKVLVVFYSMTGNVFRLAQAVVEGALDEGAEVRLRKVQELIPPEVIQSKPHLLAGRELTASIEVATNDDLRWAEGVCFGSPTRYGNMAAQLKNFIDQTGELWLQGALVGKVAGCFTSSGTQHGGQESTLLSMMVPLLHLGFLIQGLPYSEQGQMGVAEVHGGSPYGVSSISGPDARRAPTAVDLELARALGRRVALAAHRLSTPAESRRPAA
jgi:NAD(P)H dehydrogenase (quinone)